MNSNILKGALVVLLLSMLATYLENRLPFIRIFNYSISSMITINPTVLILALFIFVRITKNTK
jgi:hypothetical protein